jgi:hypothetical protein
VTISGCPGPQPPGEHCSHPFEGARIRVVRVRGRELVRTFRSGAGGRFRIRLAPGRYMLEPQSFGIARATPISVNVSAHRFRYVRIDYDSGLRWGQPRLEVWASVYNVIAIPRIAFFAVADRSALPYLEQVTPLKTLACRSCPRVGVMGSCAATSRATARSRRPRSCPTQRPVAFPRRGGSFPSKLQPRREPPSRGGSGTWTGSCSIGSSTAISVEERSAIYCLAR